MQVFFNVFIELLYAVQKYNKIYIYLKKTNNERMLYMNEKEFNEVVGNRIRLSRKRK